MLLESWPGSLSALRATWKQSGPGCKAPISHCWHVCVMVCQISLPLSFLEVELLHTWIRSSKAVCVNDCMLTVEMFCQKVFFFFLFLRDVPWRLSHAVSARYAAKYWAFCPEFLYSHRPSLCPHLPQAYRKKLTFEACNISNKKTETV